MARLQRQPTNYDSTPDFHDVQSSNERRLYDGKFRLNASSDGTYVPSPPAAANRRIGKGSGFVDSEPEIECRLLGQLPVSIAHRRFGGVVDRIQGFPSPPLLVPVSLEIRDVPMSLGEGKNTDGSGLADIRHAIPESSLPLPTVSLPSTVSSAMGGMLDTVEDIARGVCRSLSLDMVRYSTPPAPGSDSSVSDDCNMYTCSGNCIQERSAGFPMFSLITFAYFN